MQNRERLCLSVFEKSGDSKLLDSDSSYLRLVVSVDRVERYLGYGLLNADLFKRVMWYYESVKKITNVIYVSVR